MMSSIQCPIAKQNSAHILLAHGEGSRLSRQLLCDVIRPHLRLSPGVAVDDAAVLAQLSGAPVITTDSFVVSPLFFPGGDIGTLAVYGTVNDLTVAGARPRWLSLGLILEEGLPVETLERVLNSIASATERADVSIVTGDTKVVPRGAIDKLFINTTGVGELINPAPAGPAAIEPNDEVLISGPIGRHGIAVLAAREQLGFDPPPVSDCTPLIDAVNVLRDAAIPVRALRDATRGGLAAVLHEWAAASGCTFEIDEGQIPITDDVRGACELLGLDPLFIACEGTMAIAVPAGLAEAAAKALRQCKETEQAAVIGSVQKLGVAPVTIKRLFGRLQPLDEPSGMLLPRIC